MQIDRSQIEKMVEEVVSRYSKAAVIDPVNPAKGIFTDVDQAIAAAEQAQQQWVQLSLVQRKEAIQALRDTAIANAEALAELAAVETGMGRVPDKVQKNLLAARKTPGLEDLTSVAYSGDNGLTLVEQAPYGVLGAITPSTNPTSSIINNAISMVAAGNSVVFSPHPSAKRCSNRVIELFNEALAKSGAPVNLIAGLQEPTLQISQMLMTHPKIKMLVVTGGPAVVDLAMRSGKKTVAAGPGNPPVVVDDSADIPKAAEDIVKGASFDNNVMCIAEKEVFAVEGIFGELKRHMKITGAYELTAKQVEDLTRIVILPSEGGVCSAHGPGVNRAFIGKPAQYIAKAIGLDLPAEVRLLFAEVDPEHPLVMAEQLMPLLPLVRVRDVHEAIERAIQAEHGWKHTAMMHSRNVANLSRMAYKSGVTIFVKNAPSYAGLGFGGEGFTTLTIAGPTGEGVTSARSFTRQRRCVLVDYFRII